MRKFLSLNYTLGVYVVRYEAQCDYFPSEMLLSSSSSANVISIQVKDKEVHQIMFC